jgi:hypothetical protein
VVTEDKPGRRVWWEPQRAVLENRGEGPDRGTRASVGGDEGYDSIEPDWRCFDLIRERWRAFTDAC